MRMLADDTHNQMFNVCLILRRDEFEALLSWFRECSEMEPGDHWHIDGSDRPRTWLTYVVRGVMLLCYRKDSLKDDGWNRQDLFLIKDAEGELMNLGSE